MRGDSVFNLTRRFLQLSRPVAFLPLAMMLARAATACDLCSVYSATQAGGWAGKGFFAGLTEQFTAFGTLQVNGHEVANPAHQFLDSSISQIFVGYNFSDRVGLQFNASLIYRSFKRSTGDGGIESGTESGLGDVSVLGNLALLSYEKKKVTFDLHLIAGVKFPTGSSRRLQEELQESEETVPPASAIHGHDLTLGTGSVDGIVGVNVFARMGRAFATGIAQYAIRSQGDYDYRFADDLTWAAGPGAFLLLKDSYTLSLQVMASGEYKKVDEIRGAPAEDTGLTAVYLGPQLSFTYSEKLSFSCGADFPVVMRNTSLQAVPDYRIRAALTYRF